MIQVRRSADRGQADHGWLRARHSFSFAEYVDPAHMGFRDLRVLNEDWVAPGQGFPTHPHRDMEILTYVLEGAVEHRDDMGNRHLVPAGSVQRMSAGRGVRHSEANPSSTEPLRLFQIWLQPRERGLEPGYEQAELARMSGVGALRLVASPNGTGGSLRWNQDARLWAGELAAGAEHRHELAPGRGAWVQVASGQVELNGHLLEAGDGAGVERAAELALIARESAELLLFDLP